MKKILAIVLVLIMTVGILAGCGQKKKETVEIYINVPLLAVNCVSNPEFKNSNDFIQAAWDMFAAQHDKYDVKLRYGKVAVFEQTAYQENIPDTYGTADCPDLSFGGYFAMSGYIYDGHIIPLDDIITDAVRADFSEATWEQSKGSDGKTYLMPFYALQNILCYNKELFCQCGLEAYIADGEVIQGWSLEDWEIILSTLQEKLPDFHYPKKRRLRNTYNKYTSEKTIKKFSQKDRMQRRII